jgi:hypothetical protein
MRQALFAAFLMFLCAVPALAGQEKIHVAKHLAAYDDFLQNYRADLKAMEGSFCQYYAKDLDESILNRDFFDYIENYKQMSTYVEALHGVVTLYDQGVFSDLPKTEVFLLDFCEKYLSILELYANKAVLSVKEFKATEDFSLEKESYEVFKRIEFATQNTKDLCDRLKERTGQ